MRLFSRWCLVLVATCLLARAAEEPPTEWIDPETGHRVVRLSREGGTASLYFHQNAYSADGRKLVVTNPGGIATIDLATRAIDQVVTGRVNVLVTGRKSGDVYYLRDGAVYATNLDTHATRKVAKFPAEYGRFGNVTVNADESLIVGLAVDPEGKAVPRTLPPGDNGGRLSPRWAQGLPMVLFTINTTTSRPTGNFLRATAAVRAAWPRRAMVSGFIFSGRRCSARRCCRSKKG